MPKVIQLRPHGNPDRAIELTRIDDLLWGKNLHPLLLSFSLHTEDSHAIFTPQNGIPSNGGSFLRVFFTFHTRTVCAGCCQIDITGR